MNLPNDFLFQESRRQFLSRGKNALGMASLATLLQNSAGAATPAGALDATGQRQLIHFAPKAKRVIYLHMVGGPSQMDLFDYKPKMAEFYDKDLPDSIRKGQRLTTMTSGQARFPIAPSKYQFKQHGKSGMWVSEMLPWTSKVVDDMCFIRSMHTEAINHEPAITAMQTGNMVTGRPCLGSWLSYGLGSMNADLPTFVVMVARATNNDQNQAISGRLWSSGFLDGKHAGVTFRAAEDPILFLRNPSGISSKVRRASLDSLNQLNTMNHELIGDPEIRTRIEQYELAFRMQSSVPELTETKSEPKSVTDLYGDEVHKAGSLAHSMLLARRMTERGVRFVQIYHNNWDHHANLTGRMKFQCGDLDQPTFGLLTDLKQRGMLDDTLVIWGGEFGRTIYSQGQLTRENYGRDHHPRCFTMWMAGGGSNGGHIHGETDDFSYNITRDPVHVRDLHASVLHLLGFDHERFTVRSQGLDQRLTGVEPAKVIKELLA
jgi:hypothetical protein